MKCHYVKYIFLLFVSSLQPFLQAKFVYHDFDTAMNIENYRHVLPVTNQIVGIDGEVLYEWFKRQYQIHIPISGFQVEQEKIPRIIHQIWLGSALPDELLWMVATWKNFCAEHGWSYILWTDADVASLHLYNQDLYDEARNFGMKSDIARLEILYRFGGFYVDIDCEYVKSLQDLISYDLVIGLQPLASGFLQVNNALIGSSQRHPTIQYAIATMKENWRNHHGAPQKCGPVHLTRSLYATLATNKMNDLVLPALYFYPTTSAEVNQGSYAIHHWAKTWMPVQYRSAQFKTIKTDEAATQAWDDY